MPLATCTVCTCCTIRVLSVYVCTGTESQRILVMSMKQLAETEPMGAFDAKGRCIYANSPLASMLGYKLKMLKTKDITQLLPQPYGVMHLKYVKVRASWPCDGISGASQRAALPAVVHAAPQQWSR